ncbi:hypothetical protein E3N88_12240 [Mikania micrantha]|uniref:DUF4219 domain-containing protein n=1 Tax=Mikania micrantha TaxID=192012 RepID=A0A5N6P6R1_9ASTR|nr:hypothetical protein E3N88_12240 [Mikania micrantha]
MAGNEGDQRGQPIKESHMSLECSMLNTTNYNNWTLRLKEIFRVHGMLQAIEPRPVSTLKQKKDNMAIALLLQSIPEELVVQVSHLDTAKKIWDALKTQFIKDQESINDYAAKTSCIVSKAASLGGACEDKKLVRKLLGSVPHKFIPIVSSIEQFADLKIMSFQEGVRRLKTYEERLKGAESTGEAQGKLLLHQNGPSQKSGYNGKGKKEL